MDEYFVKLFNELSKLKTKLDSNRNKNDVLYKCVANNYNRMVDDKEPDFQELRDIRDFFGQYNNTERYIELINAINDYLGKYEEKQKMY